MPPLLSQVSRTFFRGRIYLYQDWSPNSALCLHSCLEEGERWIHNSPFSSQQDTYSLKTRCGSSENTSCPTFLHRFTALASNEEPEDFTLKINKKKDRKIKLYIGSTWKVDMRKWRFLSWFPVFFLTMLNCEIIIEFSFLLYNFYT